MRSFRDKINVISSYSLQNIARSIMLVLLKQYIYGSIIQMAMNGSNFLEELYR